MCYRRRVICDGIFTLQIGGFVLDMQVSVASVLDGFWTFSAPVTLTLTR